MIGSPKRKINLHLAYRWPMSPSVDDYGAIRARRDELYRERAAVIRGEFEPLPDEWLTPEAAARKYGQSPSQPA